MKQSTFVIILDLVKEIAYFPLWWYSRGVEKYWQWAWDRIKNWDDFLAFRIMFLNLYRPLYGDYSLVGILIGPVIRTIWFLFLLPPMLIGLLLFIFLFLGYLAIPPLSIYMLFK
ncbi:MAG: hypothetical protein PHW01_00705 [Patescibacteria group bacterium]|nr:hypothetical protein [Patescibacteria group bacterium]